MSSRIRILFHCASEGPTCHVGRKALLAMYRHLAPGPSGAPLEWVDARTWFHRGKPQYKERQMDFSTARPNYIYRVPRRPSEPPTAPVFKGLVEEARWLWENLPQEIRATSQLIVTRESRASKWQRSRCNPAKYGWKTAGDRKKNAPQAPKGWVFGSLDYAPAPSTAASWFAVDSSLLTGPLAGQGLVGQTPAPPEDKAPNAFQATYQKYKKATQPVQEQAYGQDALGAGRTAKKARVYFKKPKLEAPEEDFEGDSPEPVAAKPRKSKEPEKARLRIGIWS
jgi:hypothetical protein